MSKKDQLPDLTPKQRKFVMGLLRGMTASDAYRAAYGCEGWKPESVWSQASALKRDDKVRVWLDRAREAGAEKAEITSEWWNRLALDLYEKAVASESWTAARAIASDIARVNGLVVDKSEVTHISSRDVEGDLIKLLGEEKAKALIEATEATTH